MLLIYLFIIIIRFVSPTALVYQQRCSFLILFINSLFG